jgi:hypothetical protein
METEILDSESLQAESGLPSGIGKLEKGELYEAKWL